MAKGQTKIWKKKTRMQLENIVTTEISETEIQLERLQDAEKARIDDIIKWQSEEAQHRADFQLKIYNLTTEENDRRRAAEDLLVGGWEADYARYKKTVDGFRKQLQRLLVNMGKFNPRFKEK